MGRSNAPELSELFLDNTCGPDCELGDHHKFYRADNPRNSSFLQATFNSVNILLGIGILSSPYTLQKGGWLGLSILFLCAVMFCYTAYTLGLCLSKSPAISTYQEIAELAFGRNARVFISILLYFELVGVLVSFTISLGDNLVKLFPGVELRLSWLYLSPNHLLPIVAILLILPTVWVRDLSFLSYVSLGGVVAYLVIVVSVTWAGVFNGLGFHHNVPAINLGNLPTVTGLSAYCYSGHVVFPSICSSIKNPSHYPKVLVVSFVIATTIYTGFGVIGATMFGDDIQSQVTLNLPSSMAAAKISAWVVVIIPLTKYSIAINPIAVELESLVPQVQSGCRGFVSSMMIRSMLMAAIVALAMVLPYFDSVLSFVGSALSITMCIVFPCAFYVKIFGPHLSRSELLLNYAFVILAIFLGITGSVDSIRKLLVT